MASRLRSLTVRDWQLLALALPRVAVVRSLLWVFSFTRLHGFLTRRPRRRGSLTGYEVDRCSWAVSVTARLVPRATCLTQAFALQSLLRNLGEASRVEVGFIREGNGEVKGHAWLMCRGRVVIGGRGAGRFTGLLALEG